MYILCTIDCDDTFLHGFKEIFYVKFTSVILPEIVSRQNNMIKDKDLVYMCRHPKFGPMISRSKHDFKVELCHNPYVNITYDHPHTQKDESAQNVDTKTVLNKLLQIIDINT